MSSRAFAFVVLSFLDRLRKYTTTLGSDIDERSGGSATYDNGETLPPKADEKAPVAARALLACALACRLLISVEREEKEGGKKRGGGRSAQNMDSKRKFCVRQKLELRSMT